MDIASAPMIMLFVLLVVSILKASFKKYEKFLAFIPLIASVLGLGLAILAFYVAPDIVPVDNIFSAMIMGLFSGMTAVGSTEMLKGFIGLKEVSKKTESSKETPKLEEVPMQGDDSDPKQVDKEIKEKADEVKQDMAP